MLKKRKVVYRRSGFEDDVEAKLKSLKIKYEYETVKLTYTIPESKHTYTPDFIVGDIHFEAKGYFDAPTKLKMKLVIQQNPDKRIIMVFQNPNTKLTKKSKTTYATWCDKNNIEWCTFKTLESKLPSINTK